MASIDNDDQQGDAEGQPCAAPIFRSQRRMGDPATFVMLRPPVSTPGRFPGLAQPRLRAYQRTAARSAHVAAARTAGWESASEAASGETCAIGVDAGDRAPLDPVHRLVVEDAARIQARLPGWITGCIVCQRVPEHT